jgi:glycosyltransferase involved in cell wall biosynthesis
MPLISFIMPNHNKAVYLSQAIQSLLNQTLRNIEVIVVDDDSTDDSRDIIDTFARRDKRIVRKYLNGVDGLPVAERIDRARNVGNQLADADIICVCDSDDWNLPERARITYETFKNEKECGLFYSSYLQRDRFGKESSQIPSFIQAVQFSAKRLKETGFFFIGHLTVGYKKETILRYPYNTHSGVGDWGMFYSLLIKAKVKPFFTIQPLCVYRVYGNSLNQLNDADFHKYLFNKKRKKMELLGELKDI